MLKRVSTLAITLLFTASLGTPLVSNTRVSAVSAADWKAGRIIDDSIFTDKTSMTVEQIQAFLNLKVGTGGYGRIAGQCDTLGEKISEFGGGTRAEYGASRGNPAPFTCLKDYHEVPKTDPGPGIPASNYGGAPIPAGAKSAAQLIWDASQRYSINPKTLLVTIQKESAGPLTTDDWPFKKQYTYAMGAHCPDSGPNGSANCDENYAGFSMQIMESARLFRYYLDSMSQPWWPYKRPGNNSVLYNPNRDCGASNVFIESMSTAALYTYTPYQPNQAALNNMYGSGDGCSAYGNRNFWRIFNDWFGGVNGGPYEWQLISQEAYSDAAMTRPFTSTITAEPNQNIYFRIKVRNTGYLAWDRSFMRLGASEPRDRTSVFQDPSWLSGSRAAPLTEASVAPTQVGTFDFIAKAPAATGSYYEYFTPVAEGKTWLRNIGMYYPINVVSPIPPVNTTRSSLDTGQELKTNEYILSPDTHSALVVQPDGKAALISNHTKTSWSTGTQSQGTSKLVMQQDGNLVLLAQDGTVLWHAGTSGHPGSRLVLQTDGNLVIYNQSNVATWSASVGHTPDHLKYVNTTLRTGIVFPGQSLETANRKYRLIFQNDGNLVIYSPFRATWSSGTFGKQAAILVMQADGNLVIYNKLGQPLWHTGTSIHGASSLVIQPDGNLVIYKNSGPATWNTRTAGQN